MKRSEINQRIEDFISFAKKHGFNFPELNIKSPCALKEAKARQLGWDITDFGLGDFEKTGLSLFTIRNGNPEEEKTVPYCEKVIFSAPGQKTPRHFHKLKTEDIFVRGGSDLIIKLWPSKLTEKKDGQKMKVLFNGSEYREIKSGEEVRLRPGETVTLTPAEAHEFYSDPKGRGTLIGEVSTFNDDESDNYFFDSVYRFPEIEEDEKVKYYLVSDYAKL